VSYSPLELAVAFIQTGELEDALEALGQHLAHQPDDDRVRRWRLQVLRHLNGDSDQALADLQRLSAPTPADFTQAALLLEAHGDHDAALNLLAEGHGRWPHETRLAEVYLRLLMDHHHIDIALSIARAQPTGWRWLEWEGDLLARQGDDVTATARYGLALAHLDAGFDTENIAYLAPIKARLLLARAHAYRRLGYYDLAADHYSAAEQLMPTDPMIPFNRGLVACLQGDQSRALTLCQSALSSATPALHEQMRSALQTNPAYAALLPHIT
jgi:Flp pilus assembly protein TadD